MPVDADDGAFTKEGVARIVTWLEGVDGADVPALLVAVTVNEYTSPPVNPVIVAEVDVDVAVCPPLAAVVTSVAVTVYLVIAELPVFVGAVHVIVACPFPAVAVAEVGLEGAVITLSAVCACTGWLQVPRLLAARTETV
jgi:hypothetical protein